MGDEIKFMDHLRRLVATRKSLNGTDIGLIDIDKLIDARIFKLKGEKPIHSYDWSNYLMRISAVYAYLLPLQIHDHVPILKGLVAQMIHVLSSM